jgi:hypothetical protein
VLDKKAFVDPTCLIIKKVLKDFLLIKDAVFEQKKNRLDALETLSHSI